MLIMGKAEKLSLAWNGCTVIKIALKHLGGVRFMGGVLFREGIILGNRPRVVQSIPGYKASRYRCSEMLADRYVLEKHEGLVLPPAGTPHCDWHSAQQPPAAQKRDR